MAVRPGTVEPGVSDGTRSRARRGRRGGGHRQRTVRRPSRRAALLHRSQQAAGEDHEDDRHRRPGSGLRPRGWACRSGRSRRRPAGASRRGPPPAGSGRSPAAPSKPSRPTGKLRPGHEVDRLDHQLGHVPGLPAPHQEQAGQHHPEAVQGRQGQHEDGEQEAPLVDAEADPVDDAWPRPGPRPPGSSS